MRPQKKPATIVVVPTPLGWMALLGAGEVLKQLTFGHCSPDAALRAVDPELRENAVRGRWNDRLVRRLRAYAAGRPVDFRDVRVDPGPLTEFRRRVIHHCRRIPYGKTLTYGKLAAKAGSPGAARAVGNCMATNRIPLIIPCHRVLPATGGIGGFSAAGGAEMKGRLLALEGGRSA